MSVLCFFSSVLTLHPARRCLPLTGCCAVCGLHGHEAAVWRCLLGIFLVFLRIVALPAASRITSSILLLKAGKKTGEDCFVCVCVFSRSVPAESLVFQSPR